MKHVTVALVLIGFLLGGCVTRKHAVNYNTDRYTYEGLARRFGELKATDDKSGFQSVGSYGIWEGVYIKTTPVGDDLYRIDYVNLRHREGTLLKDWKRGVETFFQMDLELDSLMYYRGDYNGWRIEFSTSSDLVEMVFCWMEDPMPEDQKITLDGKVTWKWGRVLFREHSTEAREKLMKRQKERLKNKEVSPGA